MGLLETLGHLKNPRSSPFGHSSPNSARAAYSAILSLCIYALSYIVVIIMYVFWPNILSKKEISAALLDIILRLKRMHFTQGELTQKEKTNKVLFF